VIRLFVDQAQRRTILLIEPVDSTLFQILAERSDGPQELSLLHRKGADREFDRSALLQQAQSLQQRDGILAARQSHGNTITIANHVEAADRFSDLTQECLFEIQTTVYRESPYELSVRFGLHCPRRSRRDELLLRARFRCRRARRRGYGWKYFRAPFSAIQRLMTQIRANDITVSYECNRGQEEYATHGVTYSTVYRSGVLIA